MKITPSDIIAEVDYKRAKLELLKKQMFAAAGNPRTSMQELHNIQIECDKARREYNTFLLTPIV